MKTQLTKLIPKSPHKSANTLHSTVIKFNITLLYKMYVLITQIFKHCRDIQMASIGLFYTSVSKSLLYQIKIYISRYMNILCSQGLLWHRTVWLQVHISP